MRARQRGTSQPTPPFPALGRPSTSSVMARSAWLPPCPNLLRWRRRSRPGWPSSTNSSRRRVQAHAAAQPQPGTRPSRTFVSMGAPESLRCPGTAAGGLSQQLRPFSVLGPFLASRRPRCSWRRATSARAMFFSGGCIITSNTSPTWHDGFGRIGLQVKTWADAVAAGIGRCWFLASTSTMGGARSSFRRCSAPRWWGAASATGCRWLAVCARAVVETPGKPSPPCTRPLETSLGHGFLSS